MSKSETVSLYQFFQQFPDEESARHYFESKRWKGAASCGHCGSADVAECKDHKPMPYRCRSCRQHFSVRTGTVLAESRLPLQKWLMAIYMMTTARKGIPSTLLARELGITQKSAWFLAERIRETWMGGNGDDKMGSIVEIDETYIGGKKMNKHKSKKLNAGRGTVGKIVAMGILERGGHVTAMPVSSMSRKLLQGVINDKFAKGSTVYNDEHASYKNMDGYNHEAVAHSVGEYVRQQPYTNGVESFWAILRRVYMGIYHYMIPEHLHRYINEFSFRHNFRHNTANDGTMASIEKTIEYIANRRLTYKELTHVPA